MHMDEKVVCLHGALGDAGIPHAFGGALALAYCIEEPRGTADIDVNVFVSPEEASRVFEVLPEGVTSGRAALDRAERDGQVRLWWDDVPVDFFFAYDELHEQAAGRVRTLPFGSGELPFLDCTDLAVFKAFFDRPRDWVDIATAIASGSVDVSAVESLLERRLGPGDRRLTSLRRIAAGSGDLGDYGL